MKVVFKGMLYRWLFILVDDILLYVYNPAGFVNAVRRFLAVAQKFGVKLSVEKSYLFQK